LRRLSSLLTFTLMKFCLAMLSREVLSGACTSAVLARGYPGRQAARQAGRPAHGARRRPAPRKDAVAFDKEGPVHDRADFVRVFVGPDEEQQPVGPNFPSAEPAFRSSGTLEMRVHIFFRLSARPKARRLSIWQFSSKDTLTL
jgi:hypothetical protein